MIVIRRICFRKKIATKYDSDNQYISTHHQKQQKSIHNMYFLYLYSRIEEDMLGILYYYAMVCIIMLYKKIFILSLTTMDNTTPSMNPQGLNAIKASLTKINKICDALIAVLDRSPEMVSHYTATSAGKFDATDDNELNVDVIIRGLNVMDKHLDNIITALKTQTLYENNYNPNQKNAASLVEALQYKRDVLASKRRASGFLDSTFAFRFNELTSKIDAIYNKLPLYTQKAA